MKPALIASLRGVHKQYRLGVVSVPALRGIETTLRANGFTVICGASGSGKSTLLHLLGCIDTPDQGKIEIAGQDPQRLTDDQRSEFRARHIGFVFQSFNLLSVLTALENVDYAMRLIEPDAARRRQRAMELLSEVGLADKATRRPNELSGGQRQRVAIARALVNSPRLVLADEPTANLDRQTGEEIIALMRRIQRHSGASFVFSSHDRGLIEIADDCVRIADGNLVPIQETSHETV